MLDTEKKNPYMKDDIQVLLRMPERKSKMLSFQTFHRLYQDTSGMH